jgi:hypothetical protein
MFIIITLFVSGLFVVIGLVTTEKTAPYLLSGYNMMSAEAQKNVNLKSYITYLRKFFVTLGITNFFFCVVLYWMDLKLASGLVMIFYPLGAFTYFTITSLKFFKGKTRILGWIGIIVLVGAILFIAFAMSRGLAENEVIATNEAIEIAGQYGETIDVNDIRSIQLVESLPGISIRTNGFALGNARKGSFKTVDGEIVKLLMSSNEFPIIKIETKTGRHIYYSASTDRNKQLYESLLAKYPILRTPN